MGQFHPLSALQRRRIVDRAGEYVGHIRDALVDLRDGRIEYVCIALGNTDRGRPSEAIVPWSALKIGRATDDDWCVAAGKAVLQQIARPVPRRDSTGREAM